MSSVSLKNLVKNYGSVKAVDDVSLDIKEGEFFSLLGPSGCGKSTTLRMLAGFEELSSGAIEMDGQNVTGLPPEQRGIGFVFQNYAIFPHMNVFENIAFGLRLRKLEEAQIQAKVAAALAQVDMSGLEARMQSEMSGGQQQRVALARVLVTEPKVLLLDEPLSALDKNLREEMKFWIKDLQTQLGITTIYVTHDQGEALTMSDRLVVMHEGRISQVGAPQQIYETPENLFVAEFIGESSLLVSQVREVNETTVELQIGAETITATHDGGLALGDAATLVLRPEHVVPEHDTASEIGSQQGWRRVSVLVRSITYQGSALRYEFDFKGQTIVSEAANLPDTPKLQVGQEVTVRWPVRSARALSVNGTS